MSVRDSYSGKCKRTFPPQLSPQPLVRVDIVTLGLLIIPACNPTRFSYTQTSNHVVEPLLFQLEMESEPRLHHRVDAVIIATLPFASYPYSAQVVDVEMNLMNGLQPGLRSTDRASGKDVAFPRHALPFSDTFAMKGVAARTAREDVG